jgi:hypothetical protein
MHLLQAIEHADAVRINSIDDARKASIVIELEGEIAELMGEDAPVNPYPSDAELLMPAPRDNIYELYLMAMIDLENEDTQLFQNDYAAAQSAIADAKAWWRRHHRQDNSKNYYRGIV